MNTETMPEKLPVGTRAVVALNSSKVEFDLRALVADTKAIVEITNPDGRSECHAAAMKARAARVAIEKAGKDARDDATAFSKAVIAEEKRLVAIIEPEQNRLISLRDEYDEKIEAEKEAKRKAEAERVAAIHGRIEVIKASPFKAINATSGDIKLDIASLEATEIDDSFGEFFGAAKEARGEALEKLREMLTSTEAREAEEQRQREEAARLKAEREELERRQKAEREAEAERNRIEAERIAKERAELEAQRKAIAEAQANIDAARAEEEAKARAEQERIAREQREAEAKQIAEQQEIAKFQADEIARHQQIAEQEKAVLSAITTGVGVMKVAADGDGVVSATAVPAAEVFAAEGKRLKLGELCSMLGFTVTAEFLGRIGFPPAEIDRQAKLYRAADFPAICRAIAVHTANVASDFMRQAA